MKIVCCDYEINLISKNKCINFELYFIFFKDLVVVEIRNKFLEKTAVFARSI